MDEPRVFGRVLLRKGIHLLWGLLALGLIPLGNFLADILFVLWLTGMVVADTLRFYVPFWRRLFLQLFAPLLKPSEKKAFPTGATVLVAAFATVQLFFPQKIAIASILVLTLADAVAALVGIFWPVGKWGRNKTVSGSFAFFLVASAVLIRYFNFSIVEVISIGTIVTLLEAYAPPRWENWWIAVGCSSLLRFMVT